MNNVFGYIRETGRNKKERNASIEDQEDKIARYAQRKGLLVTSWVRDRDVSSTVPLKIRTNGAKLLEALKGQQNRKAYYVAVLCFILNGESYFFEGYCHGHIAHEPQGEGGFGYDPIFIPNGYTHTFGQLDSSIKKQISHRAQAMQQLQSFLNSIGG